MKDSNVFGRGIIGYGWISHGPNPKRIRMHLTELWRCLGRTQFSAVNMRKVLAGASMHLCITALKRQIRLLHLRNKAIAEMYSVDILLTESTTLEEMVTQGLIDLGWSKDERFGRWSHTLFPAGFEFEEVGEPSKWKKIAHEIRESYRFMAFEDHKNSSRHEIAGQDVGQYDSKRRKAALKWAKDDGLANMLILGAVQSPLLRSRNEEHGQFVFRRRVQLVCPRCSMENPHWDHLWECFVGVVPADTLLRRYCWPRNVNDVALCTAFLEGIRSFHWY